MLMIKDDPSKSWQDYDICDRFLDALDMLYGICKKIGYDYKKELSTDNGRLLRQKFLKSCHFGSSHFIP